MSAEIHDTAIVDPGAQLAAGVTVGPYAVVGPEVSIGARTEIGAGAQIVGGCCGTSPAYIELISQKYK